MLFKILLASLLMGVTLSFLGVTLDGVLGLVGLTTETALALARRIIDWAAPTMLLGAVVVVPVWLMTMILLPPRDY